MARMPQAEGNWGEPLEARNPERADGNLADLLDDMVYLLPSCPDLVMRKQLMKVWRLFAEKSGCWKEDVAIPLEAGRVMYPVVSAKGGEVRSVDSAWTVSRLGRRKAAPYVKAVRTEGGWAVAVHGVPPIGFDGEPPTLFLRVTLIPQRNSEAVPQSILDRHGADLAAGAVAYLAMQEGRPWANAVIAAQNLAEWQNALHDAAIRAIAPNGEIDATNYEGWA